MKGYNHDLVLTVADDGTGNEVPLFHFPVQVCKATASVDVKFDRAAPSGAEYETVYRDLATQEIVPHGDLIRGVRTGDSFQAIPDEQIKAIDAALKSKAIRVVRSVPLADVVAHRGTGFSYLQVPSKNGAANPFRLVYESLLPRKKKGQRAARPAMALIVKYVSTTREKVGVIFAEPTAEVLILQTLSFAAEVREPDEQVRAHLLAQVEQPMVDKVTALVDALNDDERGSIDDLRDEAIEKRRALVEQALLGEGIEAPVTAEVAVVESDKIGEALEASLAELVG